MKGNEKAPTCEREQEKYVSLQAIHIPIILEIAVNQTNVNPMNNSNSVAVSSAPQHRIPITIEYDIKAKVPTYGSVTYGVNPMAR